MKQINYLKNHPSLLKFEIRVFWSLFSVFETNISFHIATCLSIVHSVTIRFSLFLLTPFTRHPRVNDSIFLVSKWLKLQQCTYAYYAINPSGLTKMHHRPACVLGNGRLKTNIYYTIIKNPIYSLVFSPFILAIFSLQTLSN